MRRLCHSQTARAEQAEWVELEEDEEEAKWLLYESRPGPYLLL